MKKTFTTFFPLGFSSIITVFITIFFFTFAALSLAAAYSDYNQSRKTAEKTHSYYAADAVAREMSAHVDEVLYQIYLNSFSAKKFYQEIETADFTENMPHTVTDISVETENDSAVISYIVPISEEQQLSVSLSINYPLYENECFTTILCWQTLPI